MSDVVVLVVSCCGRLLRIQREVKPVTEGEELGSVVDERM